MRRSTGLFSLAALCGVLAMANGCDAARAVDPAIGVEVSVDSAVYHLQPFFDSYWITVNTTITNRSDHSIFIAQNCWDGRRLRRSDAADKRQLLLGSYACIEAAAVPPRRIAAGAQFVDTWKLYGSNSPQTRPPITIDDNTGSVVMSYVLADSAGRRIGGIVSNAFDVVPPIPPANRDTLRVTSGVGLRVIPDSVILSHGADHSYATVNLRVYNRRSDAIGINPCGWRVESRQAGAWQTVYAARCGGPTEDQVIAAGDSVDLNLRIEDSPELQALYNRSAIRTGIGRVFIEALVAGVRLNAESNTLALFSPPDWVLPVE